VTETLRIDTDLVRDAGTRLSAIAGQIPSPPSVSPVSGKDELSTTISEQITKVVDPVLTQLPDVKNAFAAYSGNVTNAASTYQDTDEQISHDIKRKLGILGDEPSGTGGSGGSPTASSAGSGGGGSGGKGGSHGKGAGSPSAAGAGSPSAAAAQGAPAAGGDQGMGQMGQMMQMPMQMAQQAAQVPGQMLGSLSQLPQQVMQGVQQIVEAAKGQGDGKDADKTDEDQAAGQDKAGPEAEHKDGQPTPAPQGAHGGSGESKAPVQHTQAAPAPSPTVGERAPVNPSPAPPRHAADPARDM
jgi:hypothetical protein